MLLTYIYSALGAGTTYVGLLTAQVILDPELVAVDTILSRCAVIMLIILQAET